MSVSVCVWGLRMPRAVFHQLKYGYSLYIYTIFNTYETITEHMQVCMLWICVCVGISIVCWFCGFNGCEFRTNNKQTKHTQKTAVDGETMYKRD